MSDTPQGEGWWKASDSRWYPPEQHPDQVAPTQPLPPPDAMSVVSAEPVESPESRTRRGLMIAAIAAVVIAVAVAAIVIFTGGSDEEVTPIDTVAADTTAPPPTTGAPTTGAPTTSPPATEAPTTEATTETTTEATTETTTADTKAPLPARDASCVATGVDSFGDIQVELIFANPLGSVPSLEVRYVLRDGDGTRFAMSSFGVDAPRSGERFRLVHDSFDELPARTNLNEVTCEIIEIDEGYTFDLWEPAQADDQCEFITVDSFGDIQIELTFTSPFTETTDLGAIYALRSADGIRFRDRVAYADRVAPGEQVRLPVDSLTEVPAWLDEDDVTCELLGFESWEPFDSDT